LAPLLQTAHDNKNGRASTFPVVSKILQRIGKQMTKIGYNIQDLHPELAEYWDGERLNHPLVQAFHSNLDKANELYEYKCTEIRKALHTRDWEAYIQLHERPYRLDVLLHLLGEYDLSPEERWPLVAFVWCDTQRAREDQEVWRNILLSGCAHRRLMMTTEERAHLDDLDSELTVWRGVNHREAVRGLSWTLNRKVAARFARGSATKTAPAFLACGHLRKADVIAYLNFRGEDEIVVAPESVYGIEVRQLGK
jgi:hypothetical protein